MGRFQNHRGAGAEADQVNFLVRAILAHLQNSLGELLALDGEMVLTLKIDRFIQAAPVHRLHVERQPGFIDLVGQVVGQLAFGAAYIEAMKAVSRSRRSSSTWPPSACCSTGWSPARSCHKPGAFRARPEACREERQDPGAGCRTGRKLLDSIDTSTVVGLRDRALIGVMTYTFARIGAVVAMRVEDYYPKGKRWWVRLHEKGGKRHEMPAHHNLEAYLDAYIEAAGIRDGGKVPSSAPPSAAPAR